MTHRDSIPSNTRRPDGFSAPIALVFLLVLIALVPVLLMTRSNLSERHDPPGTVDNRLSDQPIEPVQPDWTSADPTVEQVTTQVEPTNEPDPAVLPEIKTLDPKHSRIQELRKVARKNQLKTLIYRRIQQVLLASEGSLAWINDRLALAQIEAIRGQQQALEQEHRYSALVSELALKRDQVRRAIDEQQHELDQAQLAARTGFAVLPYLGPHGTWKVPIPVECSERGVWLPSTNTRLSLTEVIGLGSRSSRLDRAIEVAWQQAKANHDRRDLSVSPYLLFIVKPSGIRSYYEVKARYQRLGYALGYELVSRDIQIFYDDDESTSPRQDQGNPGIDWRLPDRPQPHRDPGAIDPLSEPRLLDEAFWDRLSPPSASSGGLR